MSKTTLEQAIGSAAEKFALEIVEAVKGASLQELMALQGEKPKRRGRKPGPKPKARKKPGPKPGRPKKKVAKKKVAKKKVVKKKVAKKPATKKTATKKRVARNYPKCAYPGCGKNRFPRGEGFCGEHWREWKAGKIKAASKYK